MWFLLESERKDEAMLLSQTQFEETVGIDTGSHRIFGTLTIPERAWAAVLFATGSGVSRHGSRNGTVARLLQELGFAHSAAGKQAACRS